MSPMHAFVPAAFRVSLQGPAAPSVSKRRHLGRALPLRRTARVPAPAVVVVTSQQLILTEDNVRVVLREAKDELGSIFGNSAENRDVGITGDVELATVDGPIVVLRLKGRFWHKRIDVVRFFRIPCHCSSHPAPFPTFVALLTFFFLNLLMKLKRVATFLMQRIPEAVDVEIEDPAQLEDSEEESARLAL